MAPKRPPLAGEVGTQENCNSANLRGQKGPPGLANPILLLRPLWKYRSGVAVNAPLHFWSEVVAAQLIPRPALKGLCWGRGDTAVPRALSCPPTAAEGREVTWGGSGLAPAVLFVVGGFQQRHHRCPELC